MALGQFGSCAALAGAVARQLRARGARVVSLDHPDEDHQAQMANGFDAELYLGLDIETHSRSRSQYFSTQGFKSEGGLRLARRCAVALATCLPDTCEVLGMRIPILRATKMPAVLCSLGPPATVVRATDEVASALAGAITAWADDPASLTGT